MIRHKFLRIRQTLTLYPFPFVRPKERRNGFSVLKIKFKGRWRREGRGEEEERKMEKKKKKMKKDGSTCYRHRSNLLPPAIHDRCSHHPPLTSDAVAARPTPLLLLLLPLLSLFLALFLFFLLFFLSLERGRTEKSFISSFCSFVGKRENREPSQEKRSFKAIIRK